jgi:hypothetical protein
VTVNPAVVPNITFTVGSATIGQSPFGITLTLSAPAPEDLTGTVTLTFTSNATNPLNNNPQVHFSNPSLTQYTFTIPKGSQTITLPNVEPGSVAGTIHIEVTDLRAGSDNVLPVPHPSTDIVVGKSKPVITTPGDYPALSLNGVTFANETANGFDIVIDGYSTPRDMQYATITFAARSGAQLDGNATFTVQLADLFNAYYQSQQGASAGSIFQGLRIPVTVSGDKTAIGSVTISLTNSVGTSDPVTKSR